MRAIAFGRQANVLLVASVLAGGTAVAAQEPPPPPPPVSVPPSAPVGPLTTAPQDPATVPPAAEHVMKPEAPAAINPERLREQVMAMEGLLTSAVKNGATAAAKQMLAFEPGLMFATGPARAKGIYLEDYGVFFHVEIPPVSRSVSMLFDSLRDPAMRRDGLATPASTGAPAGSAVPFNPDAAYVLAVQEKLIDAMLDYRLDLRPSEWLTVAAREFDGAMFQGQIVEGGIMILRIRATDLAEFHAGRLTRDEIRRRVAVSEF